MAQEREFGSFEEFWPYYVAMHSKAATRWVHLTGTLTGLAVSAYGLARRRMRYAAALPLIGYGTAWPVQRKVRTKYAQQSPPPEGGRWGLDPPRVRAWRRRPGEGVYTGGENCVFRASS
jgi:hypothetical protein